jgi:hypothetical protein
VHEWRAEEAEGNGFTFEGYHHADYVWAVKRALRVYAHPEEYTELRQSAYETVIDLADVAWAWSGEFHRLKTCMYTRSETVSAAINASCDEESDLLHPGSQLVAIGWSAAGSDIYLKGSFDGWSNEWKLGDIDGRGEKRLTMRLCPGEYMYKFKVDGEWTVADDQRKKRDESGFTNNWLEVVG